MGVHLGDGLWVDDLRTIEASYLESGGDFVVGVVEGDALAMGAIRRVSPDRAEIEPMRVEPTLQRRGIGEAILGKLEARAQELGISHLSLDTTTKQQPAQRLFEKFGYRETARKPASDHEIVFFEKRLV